MTARGRSRRILAGLDVISVGNIFADDVNGERYLQVYIVLPDRAGDDFVVYLITLAHVQDILVAQINRTALIMALETHFGRVQIFGDELAFAVKVVMNLNHGDPTTTL